MSKQPVTKEVKAEVFKVVETSIHPMWDYLEGELGGNQFFVDNAFSIADIAVASVHVNLRHAGVEPAAARWPTLAGFLSRIHQRPSFAALLAEETTPWDQRDVLRAV